MGFNDNFSAVNMFLSNRPKQTEEEEREEEKIIPEAKETPKNGVKKKKRKKKATKKAPGIKGRPCSKILGSSSERTTSIIFRVKPQTRDEWKIFAAKCKFTLEELIFVSVERYKKEKKNES